MSGLLEWGLVAASILGASAWIYSRASRHPNALFARLYVMLYLFHLGMGLYFFDYLLTYGGDSLAYWQQLQHFGFEDWITGYGYGTYVMQAFNTPFIWAGIGYFGGTVFYNLLSFIGIGLIFEKTLDILKQKGFQNVLPLLLSFTVCLSPGLHFWTGGVSKESFLILAFGLVYRCAGRAELGSVMLGFLGFFLALQVRLIAGLALFPFLLLTLILNQKIARSIRVMFSVIAAILFVHGARFLGILIQVDEVSLQAIDRVSTDQLAFLGDLGANSQIPIQEMSFIERILAIMVRPFPWEAWDIYSLVYALENIFLLTLMLLGSFFILKYRIQMPMRLLSFFGVAIGMVLIYTFTLNNFGIIYRMKSIFLPFLSLPFVWAIYDQLGDRGKFIG